VCRQNLQKKEEERENGWTNDDEQDADSVCVSPTAFLPSLATGFSSSYSLELSVTVTVAMLLSCALSLPLLKYSSGFRGLAIDTTLSSGFQRSLCSDQDGIGYHPIDFLIDLKYLGGLWLNVNHANASLTVNKYQ
jgi:hypothetical protein